MPHHSARECSGTRRLLRQRELWVATLSLWPAHLSSDLRHATFSPQTTRCAAILLFTRWIFIKHGLKLATLVSNSLIELLHTLVQVLRVPVRSHQVLGLRVHQDERALSAVRARRFCERLSHSPSTTVAQVMPTTMGAQDAVCEPETDGTLERMRNEIYLILRCLFQLIHLALRHLREHKHPFPTRRNRLDHAFSSGPTLPITETTGAWS